MNQTQLFTTPPRKLSRPEARLEFARLKKAVGAMTFQTDIATGRTKVHTEETLRVL